MTVIAYVVFADPGSCATSLRFDELPRLGAGVDPCALDSLPPLIVTPSPLSAGERERKVCR